MIAIALRDGKPGIVDRMRSLDGPTFMSVITLVELEGGVYRHPELAEGRRLRLDLMLPGLQTVTFDVEAAETYGRILRTTGFSRRRILDRMIAAQAIVHRATLVTRNGADFRDIPGLTLLEL